MSTETANAKDAIVRRQPGGRALVEFERVYRANVGAVTASGGRDAALRLAGRRPLEVDEYEELATRIDVQRTGRKLLERCARLSAGKREAIELVDLMELSPKEAAAMLGVSRGMLRVRLSRARARLRKEQCADESV